MALLAESNNYNSTHLKRFLERFRWIGEIVLYISAFFLPVLPFGEFISILVAIILMARKRFIESFIYTILVSFYNPVISDTGFISTFRWVVFFVIIIYFSRKIKIKNPLVFWAITSLSIYGELC